MKTASEKNNIYKISTEANPQFIATEAALRIVGSDSTTIKQADIARVVAQLKFSYLGALASYREICEKGEEHRKEAWAKRELLPDYFIQSASMQKNERILQIDPKGVTFAAWIKSEADFEKQLFETEELQRWIDATGIDSACRFHGTHTAPAQTPTTTPEEVGQIKAVVVASDSPAKRKRKRKLSWSVVAMPYMQTLYKTKRSRSASAFYKILMAATGTPDSPFTKVNGQLFCLAAGTTVEQGTLGNFWAEIRGQ